VVDPGQELLDGKPSLLGPKQRPGGFSAEGWVFPIEPELSLLGAKRLLGMPHDLLLGAVLRLRHGPLL
jgi:hypothetical protein